MHRCRRPKPHPIRQLRPLTPRLRRRIEPRAIGNRIIVRRPQLDRNVAAPWAAEDRPHLRMMGQPSPFGLGRRRRFGGPVVTLLFVRARSLGRLAAHRYTSSVAAGFRFVMTTIRRQEVSEKISSGMAFDGIFYCKINATNSQAQYTAIPILPSSGICKVTAI